METFLLYQHFRPTLEPLGGPPRRAYFWLHFLLQSCQLLKADSPQGDQCLVRPVGSGNLREGSDPSDLFPTPPTHTLVPCRFLSWR